MIVFKYVKWRNFLSTGNAWTEIPLNVNSTTLIVGENGVGKSTILDALCFSLFGKAFRNINKPKIVNSVNGKDCVVEIEFSVNGKDYKIIRGMKPNIFEIYCNGTLLNQEAARDYQAYLEKSVLGMNFKSFTQIVILGSASFTPFMQLTPADRRSVIEDLLDIQIFSVMNILTKGKLQTNKEQFQQVSTRLVSVVETVDIIQKTLNSLRQDATKKIEDATVKLAGYASQSTTLKDDIDTLVKTRTDLLSQTTKMASVRNSHKELIQLQSKLETKKSDYAKNIVFYSKNDICPVCLQPIETHFKEGIIHTNQEKLTEFTTGLNSLQGKIDAILREGARIEEFIKKEQEVSGNIIQKQANLQAITKNATDTQTYINTLISSDSLIGNNENILNEKLGERTVLEEQKEILLDERMYLDAAISLLKDGGIKTKIIKKYLPIINKFINKYLSDMGFFVDFNINENFEEIIKSRFRDEFSYHNFSEGEKDRIDLAILFTWRQIAKMKNSVHTNLLILDEIFDGSLDANGTDEFLKIMKSLTKETNTIVISHKVDALLDKFDKTYTFIKKKNFSVLVDNEKDTV